MCAPSHKLQLCSCVGRLPALKDRWELYRYVGQKEIMVMGLAMRPFPYSLDEIAIDEELVVETLNSEDCFDKPLRLKPKDILILRLQIKAQEHEYSFTYNGKEWEIGADSFVFTLMNEYKKRAKGIVNLDLSTFQI